MTAPNAQSVAVRGIGWIHGAGAGSLRQRVRHAWDAGSDGAVARPPSALFSHPVKNWARFDPASQTACALCALALADAGWAPAAGARTRTGLLGTSRDGSLAANVAYYRDYLDAGRTLARGNLFIYTLPSSPLAEAAVHFGFQGPLVHIGATGGAAEMVRQAARWVRDGEADAVVALDADEHGGMGFLLAPAAGAVDGPWQADVVAGLLEPVAPAQVVEHLTSHRDAGGQA